MVTRRWFAVSQSLTVSQIAAIIIEIKQRQKGFYYPDKELLMIKTLNSDLEEMTDNKVKLNSMIILRKVAALMSDDASPVFL